MLFAGLNYALFSMSRGPEVARNSVICSPKCHIPLPPLVGILTWPHAPRPRAHILPTLSPEPQPCLFRLINPATSPLTLSQPQVHPTLPSQLPAPRPLWVRPGASSPHPPPSLPTHPPKTRQTARGGVALSAKSSLSQNTFNPQKESLSFFLFRSCSGPNNRGFKAAPSASPSALPYPTSRAGKRELIGVKG